MSATAKSFVIAIAVLAVAAALLGFTKPGHRLLYSIGITSACSTSDCNSN
jgi:outer membrane protein assembly factor BamE (lipoprotein component of BamABCDE complex)